MKILFTLLLVRVKKSLVLEKLAERLNSLKAKTSIFFLFFW
jgi:hypothetical protein